MNTEELKLILETIGQIADGGTTAAIVWMVLHYAAPLIQTALIVGCFLYAVITIARLVTGTSEWAELGKSVSRAYGSSADIYVYTSDRQNIAKAIAKAKEAA